MICDEFLCGATFTHWSRLTTRALSDATSAQGSRLENPRERESRLLNPPPGRPDPERFATVRELAVCKTLGIPSKPIASLASLARVQLECRRWLQCTASHRCSDN